VTYSSWFHSHGRKHNAIVAKLSHLSDEALISYFRFENMVESEPDFCPLYAKNQKCHEIKTLNCYLCACPHFRFDDKAPTIKSHCHIHAKEGTTTTYQGITHHDCSACLLPHTEAFIRNCFSRDWFEVMERNKPRPS
jgi:hypothetical protein